MFIFSKEILFKNERHRRKVLFEGRKNENSAKRYENGHYCKTGEKSACRPLGRHEKVDFLARNQFVFFLYIYMCLYAPEILSLPVAFSLRPVIVSIKIPPHSGGISVSGIALILLAAHKCAFYWPASHAIVT